MSIARWMSSVAALFTILACASLYSWLTEPPGRNYLLIYFAICCVVALLTVAPMILITRIAFRLATKEEEETADNG
jgi:hypothetical protein